METKPCLRLSHPFLRRHHGLAHRYAQIASARSPLLRGLAAAIARITLRHAHAPKPSPLDAAPSRGHERESDVLAGSDKLARLLFEVCLVIRVSAKSASKSAAVFHAVSGAFGQFSVPGLASFHAGRVRRLRHRTYRARFRESFLLSAEELATLWHLPTEGAHAPAMARVDARQFEPPLTLPASG